MNLSQNRIAKVVTLCALYFAQGMPYGFVTYLLAPFMSDLGYSTVTVGKLTACATLPWMIKFMWGPVIDRFTLRSMGRRRPWIVFAQMCMVLMMASMLAVPDLTENVRLLFILVFITNIFASMQDVSVDALAVEVLEENERGFVNGLMFGSASGGAVFVSGVLMYVMKEYGLKQVLIVQAGVLMLIMMLPLLLRERKGEKLLPWTDGQAMGVDQKQSIGSAKVLGGKLLNAFSPRSAILMVLLALSVKIGIELHGVVANTFYIQQRGWDYAEFGRMRGVWVEALTVAGCFLGGYLADLVGHKKIAIAGCLLFGLSYICFALNPDLWNNHVYVMLFFMAEGAIYGSISVSLFAMCMDISLPAVAGTQFTLYMAMMNGSATIGKVSAGWFDEKMSYRSILLFWGIFQAVFVSSLLFFIDPHERKKSEELGINISTKKRKIRAVCVISSVFIFLLCLLCYNLFFVKDTPPLKSVDKFVNKSGFLIDEKPAIDSYSRIFKSLKDNGIDIENIMIDKTVDLEEVQVQQLLAYLVDGAKSGKLGLQPPARKESRTGNYSPEMRMAMKMYDLFWPLLTKAGTEEQLTAFMAFGEQLGEYDKDPVIALKGVDCKQKAFELLRDKYLNGEFFEFDDTAEKINYSELDEEIQKESEKLKRRL